MEHSLLHGLQLTGLIVVLGGAIFILGLLRPACRRLGSEPVRDALAERLSSGAARLVALGALTSALATLVDLFVQAADTQGETLFGGVDLALVGRFAMRTTVGQVGLVGIAFLVLVAVAMRLPDPPPWLVVTAFGTGALICTALTSHAAAQPTGRLAGIASQAAHIGASGAWIGVLAHLLAARSTMAAHTQPSCFILIAELIRRLSPVAGAATLLLLASGVYGATRNLHAPADLVTSAYGLTLLVKLVMVGLVLVGGAINHYVVRPNLLRLTGRSGLTADEGRPWLRRFGQMLELEVTAGVLVVILAGIVGSIPPPGKDGALRLTPAQVDALLKPALPRTTLVDPARFVGAPTRTVDDLRYAELMHNWAGIVVTAMGLLWVVQALGSRAAALASRMWPFLLVLLGVFVSAFADPEVWVLQTVTIREAISDPTIIEHQLGALLVAVMAWLGWRDRRRPLRERPLGPVLPVLMVVGGVLLLGHGHAGAHTAEELGTLISVQHVVLGAFSLFAGTIRWLSLRGILPERPAAILWPVLVTAMAGFLAFFYQEIT